MSTVYTTAKFLTRSLILKRCSSMVMHAGEASVPKRMQTRRVSSESWVGY
jgi:3-methyladenine DNA glycosylase AlkC